MLYLVSVDLNKNELQNAKVHILSAAPGTPAEAQLYYNSTDKTLGFYTGSTWIYVGRLDQLNAPTGDVSLNSHKITNLATPTSGSDAVTKTYADGLVSAGVSWKNPARAASTANGTLATAFENGDTLDGITLATGDRILLKDQTDATENGIYVVAASGAPTRATDADSGSEMLGATLFVEEGATQADYAYHCSTNATITLGSTSLTFVRITGLGTVTAGAGLTKTGDTLNVGAGTGITVNADDVAVNPAVVYTVGGTDAAVADGGTGSSTAAGARVNLGVPGIYATDFGDGAAVSFTITHNLNTRDVLVQVRKAASDWAFVECDIAATSVNTVTLSGFSVAPTASQYRVVVMGQG
jgi:hypothetical protein